MEEKDICSLHFIRGKFCTSGKHNLDEQNVFKYQRCKKKKHKVKQIISKYQKL